MWYGGNFHLVMGAAGFKPINFGTLLIVIPSGLSLAAAYLPINLVLHVLFTYLIFPAIFYPVSAGTWI
jgi:hypothetical protein